MPSVLLTGASRGIGRATAVRLASSGWTVFAGVRNDDDGHAVVRDGGSAIVPVQLDIASAADVAALDGILPARLDAVVNNAGYALDGPVEALALDDVRRQFDVNVVGQLAVTQAVLPRLRASSGRIVFVSSLSGRISTPMTGAYNASKFALEGLADALRIELRRWRIPVVLVEPGPVSTDLWHGAEQQLDATIAGMRPEHRELYAHHLGAARRTAKMMLRVAADSERVAAVIERSLTAKRPRARYQINAAGRIQAVATTFTPTRVLDTLFARAMT
jgi:NAD(P)-dependent dehydrogenase (short-subunit alcohol dehydrogenase family)